MTCPRCKSAMVEQKRVFHGQRKWVCPACGRVRFQAVKKWVTRRRDRDHSAHPQDRSRK